MGIIKLGSQIAGELYRAAKNIAGYYGEFFFPAPESGDGEIFPFEPPFEGGQCEGGYYVESIAVYPSGTRAYGYGGILSTASQLSEAQMRSTSVISSPLQTVEVFTQSNGKGLRVNGVTVGFFGLENFTEPPTNVFLGRTFPVNFPTDSCGNLPNPNPSPPTPESGVSEAPFPDIEGSEETLVEGIAPLALPAGLAGALQVLRVAGSIAALAGGLAAVLEELDRAARGRNNEGEPDPDEKEDPDGKPSRVRYTYGFIEGDGYINLYPQDNNRYEGIYLDILISTIPVGFGKEFGKKSPNRYKFRKLGWVAFVSPSFSIFQFTELEFTRTCLPIPEGAIGFYYHLGLDKKINGGAVGYLNKYLNEEEN